MGVFDKMPEVGLQEKYVNFLYQVLAGGVRDLEDCEAGVFALI